MWRSSTSPKQSGEGAKEGKEPAKKLTEEDAPAHMKAEELPPKPVTPPEGSRCCCTSETDCQFYPKRSLIKSRTISFKRLLAPAWKKTCPFLCTDESGKQYACATKGAMTDCQKTTHAKEDARCQDEHGDAILFKGEVCAA